MSNGSGPGNLSQIHGLKALVPRVVNCITLTELSLRIPAGALGDPTPIGVSKLFAEEIDPIFQSYGLVGKYFAGGFEGKPNGLVFKSPITVTIPVLPPRNSGERPMLFAVDVVNHTYTPVSTTLHFDPVSSTVSGPN